MRHYRFVALLVGLFLVSGVGFSQTSGTESPLVLQHPSAKALLEVLEHIESDYFMDGVDETALWQHAIAGLVSGLPDDWSYYTDPRALARGQEVGTGDYSGVGMSLRELDLGSYTRVQVGEVFGAGPADRAGLRTYDVLLEVDGVDARPMSADDAATAIVGPAGTTVRIVVARPGAAEPLRFDVERAQVRWPGWVIAESTMLPEQVGYIALHTFDDETVHAQFKEHLRGLQAAGATALVLDLRDNIGGQLEQGRQVVSELMPYGVAWQYRWYDGVVEDVRSIAGRRPIDWPLVVLVNSTSLSMAESVAFTLQASGRALVVGERTGGKGTITLDFPLSDGGLLTLAAGELTLPGRASLEGVGLTPDVWAPDTRWPTTVVASGAGAREGQVVELSIDGVVVASTVAGDGAFDLVGLEPDAERMTEPQGIADLAADSALRTAVATVMELRSKAATSTD